MYCLISLINIKCSFYKPRSYYYEIIGGAFSAAFLSMDLTQMAMATCVESLSNGLRGGIKKGSFTIGSELEGYRAV